MLELPHEVTLNVQMSETKEVGIRLHLFREKTCFAFLGSKSFFSGLAMYIIVGGTMRILVARRCCKSARKKE